MWPLQPLPQQGPQCEAAEEGKKHHWTNKQITQQQQKQQSGQKTLLAIQPASGLDSTNLCRRFQGARPNGRCCCCLLLFAGVPSGSKVSVADHGA